jgi:hypothetical protein
MPTNGNTPVRVGRPVSDWVAESIGVLAFAEAEGGSSRAMLHLLCHERIPLQQESGTQPARRRLNFVIKKKAFRCCFQNVTGAYCKTMISSLELHALKATT